VTGTPQLLGLPLDLPEGDDLGGTPLCGFLVVKMLNGEGKICFAAAATEGITSVECLGLARWAVLKLEHGLTAEFGEDEEDE
jgi:hypothetical protein